MGCRPIAVVMDEKQSDGGPHLDIPRRAMRDVRIVVSASRSRAVRPIFVWCRASTPAVAPVFLVVPIGPDWGRKRRWRRLGALTNHPSTPSLVNAALRALLRQLEVPSSVRA
jgi:hypothetical protein